MFIIKAEGYVLIEIFDLYLIVKSIVILNRNGGGVCNNDLFSPASSHVSSICDAVSDSAPNNSQLKTWGIHCILACEIDHTTFPSIEMYKLNDFAEIF